MTVGWPGSVADGRVWANSSVNRNLETLLNQIPATQVPTKADDASATTYESVPAFILADSAYPSTSRVVPTFKISECSRCPLTKRLNRKLAAARYSVENAFGICKGRFRIFNRPLECAARDLKRTMFLILAVFTLHNFLLQEQDNTIIEPVFRGENERFNDEEERPVEGNERNDTRDILLRHMRWRAVNRTVE